MCSSDLTKTVSGVSQKGTPVETQGVGSGIEAFHDRRRALRHAPTPNTQSLRRPPAISGAVSYRNILRPTGPACHALAAGGHDVVRSYAQGGMLPQHRSSQRLLRGSNDISNPGVTTMLKSIIAAVAISAVAMTGVTSPALAHTKQCYIVPHGGVQCILAPQAPQPSKPQGN